MFWILFLVSASQAEMSLQFENLPSILIADLKKTVPETSMIVYEPQEKVAKSYLGFPVLDLLQKIYGSKLAVADTVVFYCQDGYRADIPLGEFKKKKSLLAYAMENGSAFSLKGKSGPIPLAPFYLVWDHPNAASAAKDVYRWPYAVTKVDLINSKEFYAPLADKSKGYDYFMKHCFSCHSINGVGGTRGPPLNPFFTTQKARRLENYILDPKKFNPNPQMSGLSKNLKDREQIARLIVTYGKKISRK